MGRVLARRCLVIVALVSARSIEALHVHSVTSYANPTEALYTQSATGQPMCIPTSVGRVHDTLLNQVDTGLQSMKHKRILMAGLIRNIGKTTSTLFNMLHDVGSKFETYNILVLEGNSDDDTKLDLPASCKHANVQCFEQDQEGAPIGEFTDGRIKHLSHVRHYLLWHIRKAIKDYDFVLMYDGDMYTHGSDGPNSMVFAAMFGHPNFIGGDFDVVCANQMVGDGMYRDTFALRLKSVKFEPFRRHELYYRGSAFRPVASCFSGLALYTSASLKNSCEYDYVDEDTCEHVVLHRCLAQKGHSKFAVYPPWSVRVKQRNVDRGGPDFMGQKCLTKS